MRMLMRAGCFLLLVHAAALSPVYAQAPVVVEGVVNSKPQRTHRPGTCPVINPKCVSLYFLVQTGAGQLVAVIMESGVVEGTVFQTHRVRVEGEWDRDNRLSTRRITDLTTQATIGYSGSALRYPEGTTLTVEGEARLVEDKEPAHLGHMNPRQRLRFLLAVSGQDPITVEIVRREILGVLEPNTPVRVDGKWTDRNVLRAERVQDTRTGVIIR